MKYLTLIILLAVLGSCNGNSKKTNKNNSKQIDSVDAKINPPTETKEGIVYFSNNNGISWQDKSEGLPDSINLGLGAIAVSENMLGIAVKESGIFLFDFPKNSWKQIPTDNKIMESNLGALVFFNEGIFVGTQKSGVFTSSDNGKSWTNIKNGLSNLSIRKLIQIDDKLYACTDAGLYSFNENEVSWELIFGNSKMQVNGMTDFEGSIYIGTNQGAFTTVKGKNDWKQILSDRTLHNISSDDNTIYAMVYNELLASKDKGKTWQNIQNGLPSELYTFNIVKNGNSIFAGQWDGVYRKDNPNENWKSSNSGLPAELAITNMKLFNGIIVVSGNERGLRNGMTVEKSISYNYL